MCCFLFFFFLHGGNNSAQYEYYSKSLCTYQRLVSDRKRVVSGGKKKKKCVRILKREVSKDSAWFATSMILKGGQGWFCCMKKVRNVKKNKTRKKERKKGVAGLVWIHVTFGFDFSSHIHLTAFSMYSHFLLRLLKNDTLSSCSASVRPAGRAVSFFFQP